MPRSEGEKVRKILIEKNMLLTNYKIKRNETFIYFPVKEGIPGYDITECTFEKRAPHPGSVKKYGISSFDTIGDIAIVDIPEELQHKKEEIAETLLTRKPINTVVEKVSKVKGEFRTRNYQYILGEKKCETYHKEHGLTFKVDINQVYFNPRLATERLRIAEKVTPGERVTDMFCGVGPFSLMIAKFSPAEKIFAIDINPKAIELLKENLKINNINNVTPILGDAKEEISRVGHTDRIIMNLPQKALEFLPHALQYGDIIHYYTITADMQGEIEKINGLTDGNCEISHYRTVKSYSPDMELYRIDIVTQI